MKPTKNRSYVICLLILSQSQTGWVNDIQGWHLKQRRMNCDSEKCRLLTLSIPVYISRNHHVETAIGATEDEADFSAFHQLHEVLQNLFQVQLGRDKYRLPPKPEEVVTQTFCGT